MCVKHVILLDGDNGSSANIFEVEGTSYAPEGKILGLERLVKDGKLAGNVKRFA